MDLIRLHKKALDTNLHNLKVDYQKQFDAEQQLNFQNTSGSGQLTDVQVFQGFNQEQSTYVRTWWQAMDVVVVSGNAV